MDRSSILIQLVLIVLATSLTCNCFVRHEDYLDLPKNLDAGFHRDIADALEKIIDEDAYTSFPRLELIPEMIRKASEESYDPIDKQVYTDLVRMESGDFTGQAMDTFLSICAQDDEYRGLLWTPVRVLKHYLDLVTVGPLLDHLELLFRRGNFKPIPGVVNELNAVFAVAFNMKGDVSLESEELRVELSHFNPVRDQTFNAKKMMRAIREITNDKSTEDNFELFQEFMLERCELMMKNEDLREIITAIDVLRYLRAYRIYYSDAFRYVPLRLVDEYNRLCLALKTPETSTLISNNLNDRLEHKWCCF